MEMVQLPQKNQIELGIIQNAPLQEGEKETPAQSYIKSFYQSPSIKNQEYADQTVNDTSIVSTADETQTTQTKSYVRSLFQTSSQPKADASHLE